ncbi:MAG: hypothetical protein AB7P14_25390 [Blastocatellales bacterium]
MNNTKAKLSAKKERFLRDQLPVRLGNLASNLARIESISRHPELSDAAARVLTESKFFIEWTAADANLTQQVELLELQRTLARWELVWDEIWNDPEKLSRIAAEAREWSNNVLELSGLLHSSTR